MSLTQEEKATVAPKRYLKRPLLFGVLSGALMLLACGGCWLSISRPLTSALFAPETHDFGEEVSDGDLQVNVSMERGNSFGSKIRVKLLNKHPNKVVHWRVWEFGPITDEHSNEFFRQPLGPYAAMGVDSDTPALNVTNYFVLPSTLRVDPGQKASLSVFYESLPQTSKEATVVATTASGRKFLFRGKIPR